MYQILRKIFYFRHDKVQGYAITISLPGEANYVKGTLMGTEVRFDFMVSIAGKELSAHISSFVGKLRFYLGLDAGDLNLNIELVTPRF